VKNWLAPAAFVLLCAASRGGELPSADPASVGLSRERLARIGATVQRDIDDKRIAGMVTLVIRHGKVAWFDARGYADREARRPMGRDAIFRICSMTKPITSTAVMMLLEEGRLLLDDPVSVYLPEFSEMKVLGDDGKTYPAKRQITIRDLLRHTSGLTYPWNEKLGQGYMDGGVADGLAQYDGTIADSVRNLARQPLLFNPGDRFEYSLGIDVLGRVVEVVSGMPLDRFFQSRILGPLGMGDTFFFVPDDKLPRLAAAYTYDSAAGLAPFPVTPLHDGPSLYTADYPYRGPRKLFSGGAGLCSTATDYARFCLMMLNKGEYNGVRILSRKSVEIMTHDQLGSIGKEQAFGIGFGIEGAKAPLQEPGSVGAYNWGGFFYTSFQIDPVEDMVVISMAQLHPTGGLALDAKVKALAYAALEN
jgi:CubicO group peptidase (beta-lactamase class C family)